MLAETIVPIGSPASVLSVSGIILLIVCLLCIVAKGVKGWFGVLNFALLGICWVSINTPDIGGPPAELTFKGEDSYTQYIWWKGEWQNRQELVRNNVWFPDNLKDEPWRDQMRYKMHVDGLSPRLYHPDSLYYAPLMACGIALLLSPVWLIITVCGTMLFGDKILK